MGLTKEQLALRLQGVTGSEIGAVAGLSPYSSPLQVALIKFGEAPPFIETPDIKRGNHLEAGICSWWAEEVGATDVTNPGTLVWSENPLVIATPDRAATVSGARLAVEAKAPRSWARGWGMPWTDQIPPLYLAQVHWEMAALSVSQCHVPALRDDELCVYLVNRNEEFLMLLVEQAERFWRDFIVPRKYPPASAPDTTALKALLPESRRPRLALADLPQDATGTIEALRAIRSQWKELDERKDALENRVKQMLGDAEGLETPWGSISWKNNKPTQATDWKAVVTSFRQTVNLYCSKDARLVELAKALEETVTENTTQKPGARPFVVRLSEAA